MLPTSRYFHSLHSSKQAILWDPRVLLNFPLKGIMPRCSTVSTGIICELWQLGLRSPVWSNLMSETFGILNTLVILQSVRSV
jgi:hypothetical protein